jgi:hypothetical protein
VQVLDQTRFVLKRGAIPVVLLPQHDDPGLADGLAHGR